MKEVVGLDAASRQRLAELEDENQKLKAQLAAAGMGAAGGGGGGGQAANTASNWGANGGRSSTVGGFSGGLAGISVTNYEVEEEAGCDVRGAGAAGSENGCRKFLKVPLIVPLKK